MLRWSILAADMVLGGPILYLAVLSLSAMRFSKRRRDAMKDAGSPSINFGILVPAHNEEAVLDILLGSLCNLAYPRDMYTVYVVADNCTDRTATLARATGWARVYERHDDNRRGKGYALNWILRKLQEAHIVHDAYVVFDADSLVEPTYLHWMAHELAKGALVAQGRNTVLNATDAPSAALRLIGVTLVNDVRHLGRNGFGSSATLANGMCLSRGLLVRHPWEAYSLGEDYEYYLNLVADGIRVHFVPEAVVYTQMPITFAQMRTQDIRWESFQGAPAKRKTAWRLFRSGLRRGDFARLDALAELLTPPLSVLVCGSTVSLIAGVLLEFPLAVLSSLLLFGGLASYLGTGLYLLRPPRSVYRAFLYAPAFMVWKLWVVLVLARSKKYTSEWVRTSRTAPERSGMKG
jgi:glycosyltransferase involved in cell wall biosynthesis